MQRQDVLSAMIRSLLSRQFVSKESDVTGDENILLRFTAASS